MGFPIRADEDHANQVQNRVFYELCDMIIHILGSPNVPVSFRALFGSGYVVRFSPSPVSGAAFASLFLGISIALMMFGSVLFVIGFILMPWVVALVFLFYFVALLSGLSRLSRAILDPRSSSRKAWKLS